MNRTSLYGRRVCAYLDSASQYSVGLILVSEWKMGSLAVNLPSVHDQDIGRTKNSQSVEVRTLHWPTINSLDSALRNRGRCSQHRRLGGSPPCATQYAPIWPWRLAGGLGPRWPNRKKSYHQSNPRAVHRQTTHSFNGCLGPVWTRRYSRIP